MATLGGVKGIISTDGKVVLPLEYESIEQINQSILVRKKGNSTLLNKDLVSITAQQYDDIKPMYFENGYNVSNFIVTKDGKKGIIDGTGKVVMDIKYDNFIASGGSYRSYYKLPMIAVKGGKHGMVDLNNKVVIPFEYENLLPLNSFLTIVGKNGKFGVIEIYNPATVVMPIEYKFIAFKQGKNLVAYKDKFLKFNVNGSKITAVE